MAINTGNSTDDAPLRSTEESPPSPSTQPPQHPTRADFGFDYVDYHFDRRRNALASLPPPRLSRGDTTDTQPLTTGDWEEIQHERDLAAAIPSEALSAARREAVSERSAIMLAAKSRIEDLEEKGKRHEQRIEALEKENERLGQENERLSGKRGEDGGKGRDAAHDNDEERAELKLENVRMREEMQGMME